MLTLGGLGIRAVSVGGLETCIEVPSWRLCFDIGRCPPTAPRLARVLFTHAHVDHMGGVAHHCATRDLLGMPPPDYFVPAENEEAFHELLAAWRRLDRSDLPCRVHGVRPGDRLDLGKGRQALAFRSPHRVPTLGYALLERRGRLRDDLVGLPGEAIRAARERGEPITVYDDRVELAFCGDTVIDVVDREPLVRTARVLVLEVTFLDDRVPVETARAKGHVHLDEIVERAHLFENEVLLFTHFSARYGRRQIEELLARKLPDSLRDRVVPLLPD